MNTFWIIFAWGWFVICLIFFVYVMKKYGKECVLPFPTRVKFRKALLWWLSAGWRTYDKRGRRKYCSECGWKVVYIDELYDENYIRESIAPNVIAVCSFCGTEYEEVDVFNSKRKPVLPIRNNVA